MGSPGKDPGTGVCGVEEEEDSATPAGGEAKGERKEEEVVGEKKLGEVKISRCSFWPSRSRGVLMSCVGEKASATSFWFGVGAVSSCFCLGKGSW